MAADWTRRHFLGKAAGAAAALALAPSTLVGAAPAQAPSPLGGRFLTHVSVVRVNQIEVTPTRSIGLDEVADNRPERIRSRREAFARGCLGGAMTWAISWLALHDERQQYREARRLLASYHDRYGDEITFIPGGYFAPMFDTREHNRTTIHTGLRLVSEMVGGGYRPQSLVAGFLDAENQRDLARDEGIHVCQGQIWSQHGIDNGDGDGGICYPYYPSLEHYLKPAQGPADKIDCVCLDGWTCDFLAARREGFEGGFNSRLGVGPIETVGNLGAVAGRREMMATTAVHFDGGHARNGFGWVTAIWEVSIGHDEDLTYWLGAVGDRWPDTRVTTEGAFGLAWREHTPDNSLLDYRFDAKGTGAPGSEKELEIEWFMNREFRLALLRDWTRRSTPMVIDFTRYDIQAAEPRGLQREWSLKNVLNQKGARPQDKPVALRQLSPEDQHLIFKHYPELSARSEGLQRSPGAYGQTPAPAGTANFPVCDNPSVARNPDRGELKMPEKLAAKPLTYAVDREGETSTVKCQGRLVAGTADAFYRDLKEIASASKGLTLDLGELTYVDSMGLGTLIRLYAHARGAGCEFKLRHLGRQLRNLLKLTNLTATLGVAEEHGITVA